MFHIQIVAEVTINGSYRLAKVECLEMFLGFSAIYSNNKWRNCEYCIWLLGVSDMWDVTLIRISHWMILTFRHQLASTYSPMGFHSLRGIEIIQHWNRLDKADYRQANPQQGTGLLIPVNLSTRHSQMWDGILSTWLDARLSTILHKASQLIDIPSTTGA